MTYEKSWSDWWRQFLGVSAGGYDHVVKILCARYVEEMQHVQRYTEHAERMQYPQFREKLLRIAADEARHAEWLAEKITLFGGKFPTCRNSRRRRKTAGSICWPISKKKSTARTI